MEDETKDTRPLRQRVENVWASDPEYPKEDWVDEVSNNDTHLGYWEWVENQIDTGAPPAFDQTQAIDEGWILADNGAGLGIEADDCGSQFETDYQALTFVALRANSGSEYHIKALHRIAADSEGDAAE